MNVIARLEYELAYYDSAVHRFNHYTTRTPSMEGWLLEAQGVSLLAAWHEYWTSPTLWSTIHKSHDTPDLICVPRNTADRSVWRPSELSFWQNKLYSAERKMSLCCILPVKEELGKYIFLNECWQHGFLRVALVIRSYRPLLFLNSLNGYTTDKGVFAGYPILVCPCVGVHRKMSLMSVSFPIIVKHILHVLLWWFTR